MFHVPSFIVAHPCSLWKGLKAPKRDKNAHWSIYVYISFIKLWFTRNTEQNIHTKRESQKIRHKNYRNLRSFEHLRKIFRVISLGLAVSWNETKWRDIDKPTTLLVRYGRCVTLHVSTAPGIFFTENKLSLQYQLYCNSQCFGYFVISNLSTPSPTQGVKYFWLTGKFNR